MGIARLKSFDPRCRMYSAKSWKKTYTVKDQPRKLESGTPKYPPPCVQIQAWFMVETLGSRERSQTTIMNEATNETVTAVKTVDLLRTSHKDGRKHPGKVAKRDVGRPDK